MAIRPDGDGSQANPYVIDNSDGLAWDNFVYMNTGSLAYGDYVTFADVHVDENGNFDISGTGTSSDPFIVSTYREMLHCTGASSIHQCKLIARDETTREMTYRYDIEDTETHEITSKYCLYNPAPTTIDFNDISETYIDSIRVINKWDCNGWTFLNPRVNMNGGSSNPNAIFYNDISNANYISNLIMLNCMAKPTSTQYNSYVFAIKVTDSIMHIDIDASNLGDTNYLFLCMAGSYTSGFARNSSALKVTGSSTTFNGSDSGSILIEDSLFDWDIDVYTIGHSSNCYSDVLRTTIKGKAKCTTYGSGFFGVFSDSIFDVDCTTAFFPAPVIKDASVYNNEKVSWTDSSGLMGVTSAELLSPTTLQSKGLAIGVDT